MSYNIFPSDYVYSIALKIKEILELSNEVCSSIEKIIMCHESKIMFKYKHLDKLIELKKKFKL